mgnify:CR=1 FL=1
MASNFASSPAVILKNVRLQWGDLFTAASGEIGGKKTEPKYKAIALFAKESEAMAVGRTALLAAATERTPLRQSSTTFLPLAAALSASSNTGFMAMSGHCFQATPIAPGTKPTQASSASVRTSTITAAPDCIQSFAVSGEISPA